MNITTQKLKEYVKAAWAFLNTPYGNLVWRALIGVGANMVGNIGVDFNHLTWWKALLRITGVFAVGFLVGWPMRRDPRLGEWDSEKASEFLLLTLIRKNERALIAYFTVASEDKGMKMWVPPAMGAKHRRLVAQWIEYFLYTNRNEFAAQERSETEAKVN